MDPALGDLLATGLPVGMGAIILAGVGVALLVSYQGAT